MAADPRPTGFRGRISEREALDALLDAARRGHSGVRVLRGEAGVGKTALLRLAAGRAQDFRVVQIAGVEAEMELPFAGVHQLCVPLLGGLGALPQPQRDALQVAFGLTSGAAPDRLLVSLATLSLMAEAAEARPLLCLVDDLQWLDGASEQVLGFVARRLLAERIAIVFAVREPSDERRFAGLPELPLEGLDYDDASALLSSVVASPLDPRVRERILAEARGNPLALLELPRSMSAAELSGGFGRPAPATHEDHFQRRLDPLPADTRRLLQLAAADPVGDPLLVWRAAERLGIAPEAATPAVDAGLFEIGAQVRFHHPSVRSAAYRSAPPAERHALHAALAEATDQRLDPDRRAWHRAQATAAPDEDVAEELERSADRALARGGIAAAAAFLTHAATLTPEPARRARRLLAAARAKRDAGALKEALELLVALEAGSIDARQAAEIEELRGEIALDQRRVGEAARLLIGAARRFDEAEPARITHLKAIGAAIWAGPEALREAAEAARTAPPGEQAPADLLLDGFALRATDGYAAGEPVLRRALDALLALEPDRDVGGWLWLTGSRAGVIAAMELWDEDAWYALSTRNVRVAREMGALVLLQFGLQSVIRVRLLAGDLAGATQAVEEVHTLAEATGTSPVAYTEATLAAWRGHEATAAAQIERQTADAIARGNLRVAHFATYAAAVLYNGLGRYEAALEAARRAFAQDHLGYAPFVVPELAEAASRAGERGLVEAALEWLSGRMPAAPGDWALGIQARVRALASDGDEAERGYREAIERLGRTRARADLARVQLLYGEWLRREGRRVDAREQLRAARAALTAMGAEAFAERARNELLATGEKVRKREDHLRDELTPQERQIARLARDGLTNPEIGAELFLSPRTVEWHMKKVFAKLGITSRRALREALPRDPEPVPA
jgi:DNA-binding CsgD family transcriptional regulator